MDPVLEFKDIAEAYQYLHEWQHRLFLDDWIIKLRLVDAQEMKDNQGESHLVFEQSAALIDLAVDDKDDNAYVTKTCAEETLVHELLHLKYGYVENNSYEGKYLEVHEHQLLEQMAKSLIMAKYDLLFDWFVNFKEE